MSFYACGGEQTPVYCPAQMLPREQVVIARHCPFCFTPVQWNKLCRCSWGNTSQAAPLHDGPLLPLSSHYPVVEPPVAGTPEQLQEALLQVGVTLVKTGEFLKAVPGSSSHPQRSITRSSRAATTRAVPMPSLDQIRNPQNTTWVAIINESLDDLGPRLRKTSLISEDDWQGTGAVWLKGALEPQVLNNSTWLGNNFTGPRIYQAAGLLRHKGVARQHWHADAAPVNSLPLYDFDALPLSALHPLSPEGTTILVVPSNTRVPSQVFVPPGYVAIWRGDTEHAGDEFLYDDNLALFAHIFPPAALFEMERDLDGATLTFGTGRKHSQLVLPKALRGHDQGANVGPIGTYASYAKPEDARVSLLCDRTQELLSIQVPPITPAVNTSLHLAPSSSVELLQEQLGIDTTSESATANVAALSGTASPNSSTGLDASAARLDSVLADLDAEFRSPPSSPLPLSPTPELGAYACGGHPAIDSSIYPCGGNIAESMQSGQMLEQLQMVPFTEAVPDCEQSLPIADSTMESDDPVSFTDADSTMESDDPVSFTEAVPDCEQSLPIADSTMESDDPVSSALDDDAYDWAAEAVPDAAILANPLMETILGHDISLTNESLFPEPLQWSDPSQPWSYPTPEPPLHVTAQPLGLSVTAPTLGPYANATGLTRVRGSRYTQHTDGAYQELSTHTVPVAYALDSNGCQHLPFAEASLPLAEASLQGSNALEAANNMVDQADARMHPGVLSLLKDKRDERVQVCMELLRNNETLVFGNSLSGYNQVRVVGPSMQGSIDSQLNEAIKSGRPLRFQAAKLLAPLVSGGTRTTIHSQYYHLPELAASERAGSLTDTLPTPSAAVSSLSVEAQNALQAAEAGGLFLERNASITGFRGVVHIANKAKPFQARLYRIDGPGKKRARVTRGSFGSPEEAALHYAKLLKFEDTVYSANAS